MDTASGYWLRHAPGVREIYSRGRIGVGTRPIVLAVTMLAGGMSAPRRPDAQTFQGYRCADGTRFIVAFYDHDSRAYLQIDGRRSHWPSG